jgi:hypothetical protein
MTLASITNEESQVSVFFFFFNGEDFSGISGSLPMG